MGSVDKELIAMGAIVGVVALVGILGLLLRAGVSISGSGATGMAVAGSDACSFCPDGPRVCVATGHRVSNYPSRCLAECAGYHVVFEGRCEAIPGNW